jgi:hypothetical protein
MKRATSALGFVLAVAVMLIVTTPRAAYARPCCDGDHVYYSDCTFTEAIGEDYFDCWGQHHRWGDTSNPQGTQIFTTSSCENPSCCYGAGCDYDCSPDVVYHCAN